MRGMLSMQWNSTLRPKKDPEIIRTKMENVFNRGDQETNESVDAYVAAVRKLAKTCNNGPSQIHLFVIEWWLELVIILLTRNSFRQVN